MPTVETCGLVMTEPGDERLALLSHVWPAGPQSVPDEFVDFALEAANLGAFNLDFLRLTATRTAGHDRVFGYERLEPSWSFERFLEHVIPADRAEMLAKVQAMLGGTGDVELECRIRRVDGAVRWIRAVARYRFDAAGRPRYLSGIVQDIHDRKLQELALLDAERRLRLTEDAVGIGMWDWDVRSGKAWWSPALIRMFGLDPTRDTGSVELWHRVMHPEDRERAARVLAVAMAGRDHFYLAYRIVRPTGEVRWLQAHGRAIYDDSGEASRMLGICLDVTPTRELAEQAARASAASDAKTAFVATLSHELRTPLNAVIGFTSVILAGYAGELNAEQRKQLDVVRRSGQHLLDIVNDALDIARMESGAIALEPEALTLVPLLQEQCAQFEPLAAERGLEFEIVEGAAALTVYADRKRVGQVVRNLLSNAFKFTDRGSVRIVVTPCTRSVLVAVEDTGLGIAPEEQDKLFKSFERIRPADGQVRPGTGLGLSICKGFVEAMGGEIGVESAPGRGSRFFFTLPMVSPTLTYLAPLPRGTSRTGHASDL